MLQPQSDEDVRPVVEALRRLDPRLDVIWNPRAFVERQSFDAVGRASEKTYAPRWEVILRDKATSLHEEREYTKLLTVCECNWSGKYPIMLDRGPYAPLTMRLVEYMELWDRARTHAERAMEQHWRTHEKLEELSDRAAAHQEAAEKIYRDHGGAYWMGGAQGRAAPETVAALYPTTP